jgi:endonuclease YncB( thermonuclease family)
MLLAGCSGGPSGTMTTTAESDSTTPTSPSPAITEETTDTGDRPATTSVGTRTGAPEATEASETAGTGPETEDGRTSPVAGTSRAALVTRVIDGDTIEIRYLNGTADTVRLLGVDTPEVSGDVSPEEFEGIPDTEAGREHLREWAERADAFAREELSGTRIQVVTDPGADRRGRYGRLLAYVARGDGNRTGGGGTTRARVAGTVRSTPRCYGRATPGSTTVPLASASATTRSRPVPRNGAPGYGGSTAKELQERRPRGWRSHASRPTHGRSRLLTLYSDRGEDGSTKLYWGSSGAIRTTAAMPG